MNKSFIFAILFGFFPYAILAQDTHAVGTDSNKGGYVLAIHGGAGTILKEKMTPEKERAYKEVLTKALKTGYDILKAGKSAVEAVEATVNIMEDSPLFNAGKGAVFTHEGRNELDAAIMDGKQLNAGAVAAVTTIRNPISAARKVMEQSEHVMLVGEGAEKFAEEQGLKIVDPKYFWTQERWNGLQQALKQDSIKAILDHDANNKQGSLPPNYSIDHKFGTVGAVALDINRNLAAATSTGGMTNKKYGRIGDAPIIGAGTYANNNSAAISCTGWGEFYIRNVVAHDIAALMEYRNLPLAEATEEALKKVADLGGNGGLIAIDGKGNVAMPFNTAGMYRGTVTEEGEISVQIYGDN